MKIEDRLRDAAGAEMRQVTQDDLRPLRLPRRKSRPARRWLAPAGAILAVVSLAVVLANFPGREAAPPALNGGDGPPYYVTLPAATSGTGATVHDAVTGKKIAEISSKGVHYQEVVAAGDRRTFFLAADGPGCNIRIDRVRLASDGTVATMTRVPGRLKSDIDSGRMAVSADGKRLAILNPGFPGTDEGCEPNTLKVVDTGSGKERTWRPAADGPYELWESQTPRWGIDGRTLYFLATLKNKSPGAILAADTGAGNKPITVKVVMSQNRWGTTVLTDILSVGPDGQTMTVAACADADGDCEEPGLWAFSARTGRPLYKITSLPRQFSSLIWPDATGRHILALLSTGEDENTLVRIDDGHVRRLRRDGPNPGWSAW